jgi:hypothetical protein
VRILGTDEFLLWSGNTDLTFTPGKNMIQRYLLFLEAGRSKINRRVVVGLNRFVIERKDGNMARNILVVLLIFSCSSCGGTISGTNGII